MVNILNSSFGPAPLPDPALYPNTVYFVLPDAGDN